MIKIQRSATDRIVFMCPTCFETSTIDSASLTVSLETDANMKANIVALTPCTMVSHITVQCNNCSDYMVQIDADIVDTIVAFNKKGYRTRYSCSGHPNGSVFPYITFGYDAIEMFTKTDEDKQAIKDYVSRMKAVLKVAIDEMDDGADLFFIDDDFEYSLTLRLAQSKNLTRRKVDMELWLSKLSFLATYNLPKIDRA